jgi:hypothetical protein
MPVEITADQLRAAADLITQRGKWTRKVYAVDEHGEPTGPQNERARKWCAVGAVARVAGLDPLDAEGWLYRLDPKVEDEKITDINDSRGKRAAIAELRRLADLAEARDRAAAQ